MQGQEQQKIKKRLVRERYELLNRLQSALEVPMIVLGLVWLALLILELTRGLSSWLQYLNTFIWIVFIIDFGIKIILAPHKIPFLKKNVLTVISLLIPALRVFRLVRFFRLARTVRAVRGLRLVKLLGSLNRGMKSLGGAMQRRAFGYVLMLTLVVIVAGAAGMYAFENDHGLSSYGESLWWTVMLLTSIGSDYFPVTPEGRVLCFILAVYGFAVFGYFTATLATFFIDRDAASNKSEVAGARQITALHLEISHLREELRAIAAKQPGAANKLPPEE